MSNGPPDADQDLIAESEQIARTEEDRRWWADEERRIEQRLLEDDERKRAADRRRKAKREEEEEECSELSGRQMVPPPPVYRQPYDSYYDPADGCGTIVVSIIVGLIAGLLFCWGIRDAYGDEVPPTQLAWAELQTVASRPNAFEWWVRLNGARVQRGRATCYHPKEAWDYWNWDGCRYLGPELERVPGPGGLVRPGGCCVAAKWWPKWRGVLLWFQGLGLFQVNDADSHRSGDNWFDLAVGPPWTYDAWFASAEAVDFAEDYSRHGARFVVLERWPAIVGGGEPPGPGGAAEDD